MTDIATRTKRAWLGLALLLPVLTVWAQGVQKPSSWVEISSALTLLSTDTAELELRFSTPLPAEYVTVRVHPTAGIASAHPYSRRVDQPGTGVNRLSWSLHGPITTDHPIAVELTLALPDGHTLSQWHEAHWTHTPQVERSTRARTPSGRYEQRHGESLWVVPLESATP